LIFLKNLDGLSKLLPKALCGLGSGSIYLARESKKPTIIRPGGLGDMVLLTEALKILGISPDFFDWVCEPRNSSWLKEIYGIQPMHYLSKDGARDFALGLWSNSSNLPLIINTEPS